MEHEDRGCRHTPHRAILEVRPVAALSVPGVPAGMRLENLEGIFQLCHSVSLSQHMSSNKQFTHWIAFRNNTESINESVLKQERPGE
jgi:hypothetical protein